jgi:hypothetical protein
MTDAPATLVTPRPLWLRLLPFLGLVILVTAVFLSRDLGAWAEERLGVGAGWGQIAVLLAFLAIAIVFGLVVLTIEHRRNHA